MAKKVCKKCKRLFIGEECPICRVKLSDNWKGRVIIIDPEKSEISKKMNIKDAGEYALR